MFIKEQQVAPEFEWDEIDANAVHVLALHNAQFIACLRIIKYQKIDRMAMLKGWRGMVLGSALLQEAIAICKKQRSKSIVLSAQMHALGFYTKAGFIAISKVYNDVNIAHVNMLLDLS